jgi:hypothetical protein
MAPQWVGEIKRHFGVITEQVRSDVQQVAEWQQELKREIDVLRSDMTSEFKEVKSLVRRRVVSLEAEVGSLHARVSLLENRSSS